MLTVLNYHRGYSKDCSYKEEHPIMVGNLGCSPFYKQSFIGIIIGGVVC